MRSNSHGGEGWGEGTRGDDKPVKIYRTQP
jgi:hypothetical protein